MSGEFGGAGQIQRVIPADHLILFEILVRQTVPVIRVDDAPGEEHCSARANHVVHDDLPRGRVVPRGGIADIRAAVRIPRDILGNEHISGKLRRIVRQSRAVPLLFELFDLRRQPRVERHVIRAESALDRAVDVDHSRSDVDTAA